METHRLQKAAVDLHTHLVLAAKEVHHHIRLVQAHQANQTMVVLLLATTMVHHLHLRKVVQDHHLIALANQVMVRLLAMEVRHRLRTINTMLQQ